MPLDARQTLILAILVLFAGRHVNRLVPFLRNYSVPEPVTGGLLASIVLSVAGALAGIAFTFDLGARDTLLIAFFTTIGLSARVSLLRAGGIALVVLTVIAVVNLVLQNLIGVGMMSAFGWPPAAGLLAGSAALSGGHGTVLAWAPIVTAKFPMPSAAEFGAAAATIGLIAGGLLGGPLGHWLIARHHLSGKDAEALTVGLPFADEDKPKLDANGVLMSLLVIAIAMGAGGYLNGALRHFGITLPPFVTSLFAGIVLSNVVPPLFPKLAWPAGSPSLALISEMSLGLFLSMSLMTLNLASLAAAALPLLAVLAVQVAVCWLLLTQVVFRVLGGTYDAAVTTSGFFGLALGATPTAVAIMTAITKAHGASPRSFLVVPLVGAFFVDIANAAVLQTFLHWLSA
ncbi:MAG: sodium/glutamate symporter [Burkholderiales bacterium]|nr:sodium/glutamate symporter [Burkholderiales bacterium]